LPPDLLKQALQTFQRSAIEFSEIRASPKQRAFTEAFQARRHPTYNRKADVFVALGGNRSGKSIVCGWLCFCRHIRDRAKDGDWFWTVAQTLDRSIGGVQQELWKALPRSMFGDQKWVPKIGFGMHRKVELVLPDNRGKCLVEFRSADQDEHTFEQAKLDGVWCDERLPEAIYDRLLPRVVDRDGFILYSDIPEQWWQYERLLHAKPEAGIFVQHFSMHDNAHNLPDGAIETVSGRMTEDERKQRIAGEFVVMEGVVYKEFSMVDHVRPCFPIPDEWPKWRAIDYGGSAPTACAWFAISPNETIYLYREYYQTDLTVQKNAEAIIAMSGDEKYVCTLMDPHAIDPPPIYYGASKTIAQQYAEAGIKSTGWPYVNVMGEHAMVQRVKFKLEKRQFFVFDTCINAIREFRSWKYKCDKEGKPLAKDAYESANNHLLDTIKGYIGTNPCFTVQQGALYRSPVMVSGSRHGSEEGRTLALMREAGIA
jgi:hypothetical protein